MCGMLNAYEILAVSSDATQEQIRRAYKRASAYYHPDKNDNDPAAAEQFRRVQWAWKMLEDETKRAIYDSSPRYYGQDAPAAAGSEVDDLEPPTAAEFGDLVARTTGSREVGDLAAGGLELVAKGFGFLRNAQALLGRLRPPSDGQGQG
jgi:DnaJ-class molecular chaperone